ncbi:MAG: sugar phosphate isomerase/epimerase [Chloroflexi bacterium]|nr:sugar phosphate isomerase/epimerase [Chloroflexota bacterium]
MANIPVALQLYSVREDCKRDLPGTLRAVREMGYDGVEIYAAQYEIPAQEIRKLADDNGLQVVGSHTPFRAVQDDQLDRTVEYNRTIGNPNIIVPSLPQERRSSRQAWIETARFFDELAEKLKAQGMRTGYHNHAVEFQPLEGELPWDTLASHTGENVILQIDLGNALHGGTDPVPFIGKYPGRSITVHLKDRSHTNDKALLGEGDINWDEVFRLCETVGGTEWYIVEQESYAYPPLECVKRCRDNLRQMGR